VIGNLIGTNRKIHLLFVLQLVSMGAMEMSGPFWPVHLRSLTSSDDLFTFAIVGVYIGPMLGIMLTSTFWGRPQGTYTMFRKYHQWL